VFLSYDTVEAFAVKRNTTFSFPFLKENGELLGIAADGGLLVEPRALELYKDFYSNALNLTMCYPQYYRFTLGITLDLEKVGFQGQESRKIAKFVTDGDLVLFDTSDTRKLETLAMLEDVAPLSDKYEEIRSTLFENFDRFISNPDWYTKLNKPLFYELTHIVFFLTKNGKQSLSLQNEVYPCLMNMGLLSLLDDDPDLLAEICICLSYIKRKIPPYWDKYLQTKNAAIRVSYNGTVQSVLNASVDEYHMYLVLNWYEASQNRPSFKSKFRGRSPSFSIEDKSPSLLAKLSRYAHLYHFGNEVVSQDLEVFLSSLNEVELEHWLASANSMEASESLVQKVLNV
jgi:hypothetical protein